MVFRIAHWCITGVYLIEMIQILMMRTE